MRVCVCVCVCVHLLLDLLLVEDPLDDLLLLNQEGADDAVCVLCVCECVCVSECQLEHDTIKCIGASVS